MPDPKKEQREEPTITPARIQADALQVEASEEEKRRGDVTEVTTLKLDRTPEQ